MLKSLLRLIFSLLAWQYFSCNFAVSSAEPNVELASKANPLTAAKRRALAREQFEVTARQLWNHESGRSVYDDVAGHVDLRLPSHTQGAFSRICRCITLVLAVQ